MADIFLSYSRADRPSAKKLASWFEQASYSVWWDRHVAGGAEFSKDIERELAAAQAVLVLWSADSVKSRWVKDEADVAAGTSKLVAVSLDGTEPPLGFRQFHAIDASGLADGGLAEIRRAVDLLSEAALAVEQPDVIPATQPSSRPSSRPSSNRKSAWRLFGALALVSALGVGWYVQRDASPKVAATSAVGQGVGETVEASPPERPVDEKSIAVLPFKALSEDVNDNYFGQGMAEELLNALSQIPELKVAGSTSAFSFGNAGVNREEIGRTLDIAHLLTGTVRRSGSRLRVTAQLIHAVSGELLWSQTYEQAVADVFVIQDAIVAELARVLQFRLGVGAGAGRAPRRKVAPRAYEAYLRGLQLWQGRESGLETRLQAIVTLRSAARTDPGFADAWSAYGVSLVLSSYDEADLSRQEHLEEASQAFYRALEVEPDNARAHAGVTALYLDRPGLDLEKAEFHVRRALELNPGTSLTNYMAAQFFDNIGDIPAARAAYNQAIAVDPLNETIKRVRFLAFSGFGDFDDVSRHMVARTLCDPAECGPENTSAAIFVLGGALVSSDVTQLSRYRNRAAELMKITSFGGGGVIATMIDFTDHVLGHKDPDSGPVRIDYEDDIAHRLAFLLASVFARQGYMDLALEALSIAKQNGNPMSHGQENFLALSPGRLEMPELMRRHPAYIEFWSDPQLARLAAARRANGRPAGLPLDSEE